jgi:hypothetical protein
MSRRMALFGAVVASAALLALGGCKDTGEGGRPALKRTQTPEYDCRKSALKLCEVPQKDGKIVLYCYKGPWPHTVQNRWEC